MKKFQIKAGPCTSSLYLSWVKHVGAQIIIMPTHLVTDAQAPLIRHPFRFLSGGVFVSCIRLPANPILEHCQRFFLSLLKNPQQRHGYSDFLLYSAGSCTELQVETRCRKPANRCRTPEHQLETQTVRATVGQKATD